MALSVVAIKAAKGRNKAYKLSDLDGLYLLVTPSGGASPPQSAGSETQCSTV